MGRGRQARSKPRLEALPDLPPPACRVILLCGPPAAGKTTYAKQHAKHGDIIIDFDVIAQDLGFPLRERSSQSVATILAERNRRLATLHYVSPHVTAYVIIGAAATQRLRDFWVAALHVRDGDCITLTPAREVLYQRICNDPTRIAVRHNHLMLVEQWLSRAATDSAPTVLLSGPLSFYQTPQWRALRAYTLERDNYTCVIPQCNEDATVVDHIISRKAGGADHPSNLRSLCDMHDRMLKEHTQGTATRGRQGVAPITCDAKGMPNDPQHPWFRK